MTNFSLPLQVVSQTEHSIRISLSSYSMHDGQLDLGFTVPPSDAYNIEGCLVPQTRQSTVQESIPSALGSGNATLVFNGTRSSISVQGKLTQAFTIWFELYYVFSYSNLNNTQLISRPQEVARSDSQVVTTTGNQSTSLKQEAMLRAGRYTLETFFDSAQGLAVQETRVLFFNSTWFSLSACNPFTMTAGSTFQRSLSIAGPVFQWPSGFFSMYDFRGVEIVDFLPLKVQIARINIAGTMDGSAIGTYLASELGFSVLPNQAIQASSSYGEAIYIAASNFPLQVSILPTFGSQRFPAINTTVESPSNEYTIKIPIGEVAVHVVEDGRPVGNSLVQLTNEENGLTALSTASDGNATFYIPAGTYSLTARIGNATQERNLTVSTDQLSSVLFNFKSTPLPANYTDELVATIVIGAAINIYAWIFLPRQRRYVVK
jgi:hypothetical protein